MARNGKSIDNVITQRERLARDLDEQLERAVNNGDTNEVARLRNRLDKVYKAARKYEENIRNSKSFIRNRRLADKKYQKATNALYADNRSEFLKLRSKADKQFGNLTTRKYSRNFYMGLNKG